MRRPTETALKSRARALLEAMTAGRRWIYAVPRDDGPAAARAAALAEGLRCTLDDPATGTATFANEQGTATLSTRDDAELEVLLVEATGEDAPKVLAKILDEAGFYAQSTLLGTALDVRDEETATALATLAHMVVAWDADWRSLFAMHLGAEDANVRGRAPRSLATAVRTARDRGPAVELLEEAIGREKDPEALALLVLRRDAMRARPPEQA